ncbi:pyridoxine/pyridoxamine 5'-phosphate oxidase [Candidatus Photodesmus blepharus]|uniref:Pyridoxine/pyridoxamine 5'-phosphate oxidase n=1 Tax=Candidatus Photodesmus blepharonis TaxID=1179155 RepID=A0A084CMJ7_9GAMM|nr:pyridoxamine 5'-phosphate oxidase [Candidatus Photodesmus blepharus]KEY91026.1 pyridoxine/pyridoxamine 5'-phosphate oxidase [Candidatus Photodesmus blepharus]
MDLSDFRREYVKTSLRRKNLKLDPIDQFNFWLQEAIDARLIDPTAMTIATVNKEGQPFQRVVLLKSVNKCGFVFYTNFASRKANHIKLNNKVSLHFSWCSMERQVHVTGTAKRLTKMENVRYFSSRPKESQIASIVSKQSSKISTHSVLEGKFLELQQKFERREVPIPNYWGGFRIRPETIEFWQGGRHRLHDRFLFTKCENRWKVDRLAP